MIDLEVMWERPEEEGNENGRGSDGAVGCQKAKHSPLGIHQDSLLFIIILGALEGSSQRVYVTYVGLRIWGFP